MFISFLLVQLYLLFDLVYVLLSLPHKIGRGGGCEESRVTNHEDGCTVGCREEVEGVMKEREIR